MLCETQRTLRLRGEGSFGGFQRRDAAHAEARRAGNYFAG
jgi:hypothetical protein